MKDEVSKFTLKKMSVLCVVRPELISPGKELLQKQKIMQAVESREPRAIETALR